MQGRGASFRMKLAIGFVHGGYFLKQEIVDFLKKMGTIVVKTWLETEFEGSRHAKRLQKIEEISAKK